MNDKHLMDTDELKNIIGSLEKRLLAIEKERFQILAELAEARALLAKTKVEESISTITCLPYATAEDRIAIFLKLFRCRQDIYPKLWENRSKNTKGYSPACQNEWVHGVCDRRKVKCSDCSHRRFIPFDGKVAEGHLRGHFTVGTYAIREDDSCIFLACDFDGDGWFDDVECYHRMAEGLGIPVAVERSRSGNGAHAWIFFKEAVPARLARRMGTFILTKCAEIDHTLKMLESYDRFFPNQDYIPKGGFGNLVALPLQKVPKEQGNTVFINSSGEPYPNQWQYLSSIYEKRVSLNDLNNFLDKHLSKIKEGQIEKSKENDEDISFTVDQNIITAKKESKDILLPNQEISIFQGAQLLIPIEGFPSPLITRLKRMASFPNPTFYQLQRMRMSTYQHPRFIFTGELHEKEIILPRGILDKVKEALSDTGAKIKVIDQRLNFITSAENYDISFTGTLTADQAHAVNEIEKYDNGILSAPPSAGKTVMACSLIAKRKVPVLILLHRQPLLEQWKERITQFINIDAKDIGIFGGAKKKLKGKIDLAMIQSLVKYEDIESVVTQYGHIIIDECHHIPATSFEDLMKRFPAKYILGLTATPYRKDRLEKILFHQCGPIRYEMKSVEGSDRLTKKVVVRNTGLIIPELLGAKPPYHVLAELLTTDKNRNEMIVKDSLTALEQGGFPLVISDRKAHLDSLTLLIQQHQKELPSLKELEIVRMDGEQSTKERKAIMQKLLSLIEQQRPLMILATASLIGEGFDLADLDTLILAMPLSFKGRMIQYAGRLHRSAEGKNKVTIYDYIDSYSAMLLKMYRNRQKAYKTMGYEIEE